MEVGNVLAIIISLIGILFVAVIGVYVWTFKIYKDVNARLAEIYGVVNNHLQKGNIHIDKNEFVPVGVCTAVHKSVDDTLKTLCNDMKELLRRSGAKDNGNH